MSYGFRPDRADLESEALEREALAAFRRDHGRVEDAIDYLDLRAPKSALCDALHARRDSYIKEWIAAEKEGREQDKYNRALLGAL